MLPWIRPEVLDQHSWQAGGHYPNCGYSGLRRSSGRSLEVLRTVGWPKKTILAPYMRKQNNIADAGAIAQQHHQPVDANAATARGRQAVLKRANIIGVKVHCFIIAGLFLFRLFSEARRLIDGII